LNSFWFLINQKFTTKEISIFSKSSQFEWRAGLLDTILKGDHPKTIPGKFGLIWFSGFRGEDLNVIVYQNMPKLFNWYKSIETKILQKNPEYRLTFDFWWFNATFNNISAISWWPVFLWWRKPEYPERTTDHGQATGKLYHLRLRVECTLFCTLQI